eukprot:m.49085 g.49085  ORF g.49085 m.49085 type:complete len:56 (+) comp13342_c0_seq7:689-856(+)
MCHTQPAQYTADHVLPGLFNLAILFLQATTQLTETIQKIVKQRRTLATPTWTDDF